MAVQTILSHSLWELYDEESIPGRTDTGLSNFLGFQCSEDQQSPVTTNLFFSIYILLTSWVIMSLFIGVISMGMFDSFLDMKKKSDRQKFDQLTSEEADNGIESGIRKEKTRWSNHHYSIRKKRNCMTASISCLPMT